MTREILCIESREEAGVGCDIFWLFIELNGKLRQFPSAKEVARRAEFLGSFGAEMLLLAVGEETLQRDRYLMMLHAYWMMSFRRLD